MKENREINLRLYTYEEIKKYFYEITYSLKLDCLVN